MERRNGKKKNSSDFTGSTTSQDRDEKKSEKVSEGEAGVRGKLDPETPSWRRSRRKN